MDLADQVGFLCMVGYVGFVVGLMRFVGLVGCVALVRFVALVGFVDLVGFVGPVGFVVKRDLLVTQLGDLCSSYLGFCDDHLYLYFSIQRNIVQ